MAQKPDKTTVLLVLFLALDLALQAESPSIWNMKRRYQICRLILCAAFAILPLTAAELQPGMNFGDLISTPEGIQKTLEHCDGYPAFETALANWLERAEPSSPAERHAVRETSLRLLEDTTDRQLVLALSDGLLRHALQDVKRNQDVAPEVFADVLHADIRKAIGKKRFKAEAVAVPAYGLAVDGTVADERQATFLERFLDLAEPRVAHNVRPSQRPAADPLQSDKGLVSRR